MNLEGLRIKLDTAYGRVDRRLGGVVSLLVRTALAFDQDDAATQARSIAYYALFAISPAILALVMIASSLPGAAEAQEAVMGLVSQYMPMAADFVAANIEHMLQAQEAVGLIALVGLIWSASGVFSAVFRAINRAWGVPKSRLMLPSMISGVLVMLAIGAFFLLAMSLGPLVALVRAWEVPILGWQPFANPSTDRLVTWLTALLPLLFSVCGFILLYRAMPRVHVTWGEVWLGGLIAGLIWEASKRIFAWYVGHIASYNVVYGSLGAVIALLLWAYLSGMILLLGAEFTVVYARWRRAGRPPETRPLADLMADQASFKRFAEGK